MSLRPNLSRMFFAENTLTVCASEGQEIDGRTYRAWSPYVGRIALNLIAAFGHDASPSTSSTISAQGVTQNVQLQFCIIRLLVAKADHLLLRADIKVALWYLVMLWLYPRYCLSV